MNTKKLDRLFLYELLFNYDTHSTILILTIERERELTTENHSFL